jgi:uncharacterized protein YbaP (TraB family)
MKKFNKAVPSLFLLFFLLNYGYCQTEPANSLLWKISGNGLENESYLFGTIHIICQEQFKMDDRIKDALNKSKKIALELNLADPNALMEMQKISMNENFENIQDQFEEDQKEALNSFLMEHYGVNLQQMGVLKPFALSSMILIKMLPCEEVGSYELFFVEQSKALEIPMIGLETAEFQVGLFDQIPLKEQLDDLAKMVMDDESLEEFTSLVNAYLEEDLEKLYELINQSDMFKEYGDILLLQRNKSWIPKIEKLIKENVTFIAVGSGHLASETGVIQLLIDAGYRVEPVR